jgi:hypothetical protein
LEIEAELILLNRRRAELYRKSLEAAEDEKACLDVVANAMLAGPLDPRQEIHWPIEVSGIGWSEDSAAIHRRHARAWVKLALKDQPDYAYLGLHLCNLSTAVQARFGDEKILHLTHAEHVPAYWCPAISRVVMFSEAIVAPLDGPDALTDLYGPEASHPWHALAWEDLSAAQGDENDEGDAPETDG